MGEGKGEGSPPSIWRSILGFFKREPKETSTEQPEVRQQRRGRWLFRIMIVLLLASIAGYVAMHLTLKEPPAVEQPVSSEVGAAEKGAAEAEAGSEERQPQGAESPAKETSDETAKASRTEADSPLLPYRRPPWKWLDWLAVGLIGALTYALWNIQYFRRQPTAKFIEYTPWYVSSIIQGPIVAFVILVFVTTVSFKVSGINVDFGEVEPEPLLVIAFLLGYYGRVAREQLAQIVATVFPVAYARAEGKFSVVPSKQEVLLGGTANFQTEPLTEVTWVPSKGEMKDGVYTAPRDVDAKHGDLVQILAIPKDPNVPRAEATVKLVSFVVKGSDTIGLGEKATYSVEPVQDGGVAWSVHPAGEGTISGAGEYTAPAQKKVDKVTIRATRKKEPRNTASLVVSFR